MSRVPSARRPLIGFWLAVGLTASGWLGPAAAADALSAESEQSLSQAAAREPSDPSRHKALAQWYVRQRNYARAIDHYQRALALAPRDVDARLHLAELFAWSGEMDRSIVAYQDLLAFAPDDLEAKLGLAQVFRWSHRYTEAERLYADVLAVEPDRLDAIKGMAHTYALAGDFPSSITFWDRALALAPTDAELYVQKATVIAWQGRLGEAETLLRKALELVPGSSHALRSLGDVAMWRRQFARAATAYRRALEADPTSVDTALDLAAAYQADGKLKQAEDTVKDALRRAPDDRRALERLQEIRQGRRLDPVRILESIVEPAVYLGTLVILTWGLYRRRRLVRFGRRSYRLLYRALLPALIALSIAALAAKHVFGIAWLEEVAEPLVFGTLGLALFALLWERRVSAALTAEPVLVVGAHPDDIELGAGGFVLRLKAEGGKVYGLVMSCGEKGLSGSPHRRRAEAEKAAAALGLDGLWVMDFPDTQLRDYIPKMKAAIEEKIQALGVRLVVTHSAEETHGDHFAVFEAAKEASRGRSLFCFESVSSPQEFVPNLFVDVTDYLPQKLRALGLHATQQEKFYMDPEMIRGRAAHRGLQAGIPFAEAFWIYRWVR